MFTRLTVLLAFLFWILPAMPLGDLPDRSGADGPKVVGTTTTLNGGSLTIPDGSP